MCYQRRYIRNAIGKSLVVDCGHCPACKQSKAIANANKIRANYPTVNSSGIVAYFVTLTYANQFLPYIDKNDFNGKNKSDILSKCYYVDDDGIVHHSSEISPHKTYYVDVPVYRDCAVRSVPSFLGKNRHQYHVKKFTWKKEVLDTVSVPLQELEHISKFRVARGSRRLNQISVIYYKDVQRFVARLRLNLHRKGYDKPISFFACAEYGPTTCRAHFHLLVFAPSADYQLLSETISASWPYDDGHRTRNNIEIARNASSYVSSYVNCAASVPALFRNVKHFAPKATKSKGFGLALESYSLDKVFEAFRCGDMHCNVMRYKEQSYILDSVLLPKYVITRYFPKIKGYSYLNPDEIKSICLDPKQLYSYKFLQKLRYFGDDAAKNIAIIRRCLSRCLAAGFNALDFADIYSGIWALHSAQAKGEFYSQIVQPLDNFYAYDNIKDYYTGDVLSPSLDDAMQVTPAFTPITDINAFPPIVAATNNLYTWYHKYSKDKKIRNRIYSTSMHV